MKKATLLLVLLFILSACQSRTTPAPVNVSPTPSRTPSPTVTPTPNATERYQGTLQANQTQNVGYGLTQEVKGTSFAQTRTAQPTFTTTATQTPTPTLQIFSVPQKDVSFSAYKLATPSPESLIHISVEALKQSRNHECYYDSFCYRMEMSNAKAVLEAIDQNVTRFFLDEITTPANFFSILNNQDERIFFNLWPNFLSNAMRQALVDYLNQQNISLTGESIQGEFFDATPYEIEIDGDNEKEWLLRFDLDQYYDTVGFLVLDVDIHGQFSMFTYQLEMAGGPFETLMEMPVTNDFTGDGLSDFIFVRDYYTGGGGNTLSFQIAAGSADGLKLISEINASYNGFGRVINSYELIPPTEKTPLELKIISQTNYDWRCITEKADIYNWQGGTEQIRSELVKEPETIECAIGRAVTPYEEPENNIAIRWLELALQWNMTQATLDPDELVYVYYRLALLYSLQGNDTITRYYLNRIQEKAFNEQVEIAIYLWQQITPLISDPKILPYLLCKASENIALTITEIGLHGEVYAYPYQGKEEGFLTPMCETNRLQRTILEMIFFDDSNSPELALRSAGLPVYLVQPVKLVSDEKAWLVVMEETGVGREFGMGLFEPDDLFIYGYMQGFGWQQVGRFASKNDFRWINKDISGDGYPELALAVAWKENGSCNPDETRYEIQVTSVIGFGITSTEYDSVCIHDIEGLDWQTLLQDKNGDELSDWVTKRTFYSQLYDSALLVEVLPNGDWIEVDWYDSIYPAMSKTEILENLTSQFYSSPTPSLLRPDLEFYRARWGTNTDPISEQIYAHLTYLLALTYELEGDETQAVEHFYDIWANHPDTLWAYLAAARLELK